MTGVDRYSKVRLAVSDGTSGSANECISSALGYGELPDWAPVPI